MSKGVRFVSNSGMRHLEALAQNFFGLLIAFLVMMGFGIHPNTAIPIQITLFFTSYIRSYCIRSYFRRFD